MLLAYAAALYSGLFDSAGAFVMFFVGPVVGTLSDRHGRKPYIFFTVLMASLPVYVLALNVSLWFYFISKILGGITSLGLLFAYIADVTTHQERSVREMNGMNRESIC